MLAAERHTRIMELLDQKGSIRVSELSQVFHVTEETIRRDLDSLESDKKLRRSHGGAVKIQEEQRETHFDERETRNVTEKMLIAQEAVKSIYPGDRIILDASTTALHMARMIPDIPLTVLTNSVKVTVELSGKDKIQVISTGGILLSSSLSYVGPLAERSIDQYHVGKAFISCQGVHIQRGITDSNELQGLVKQRMIENADRVYLLVDHSKFGEQGFATIAQLTSIDVLITDSKTDITHVNQLKEIMEVKKVHSPPA